MKQSYKILSLFGIDIEVHWLFLLAIVVFLFFSPLSALLFCVIFIFVALHEITHSLVAKRKGIEVKKIILLPIGGMAVIENIEELDPWSEIKMAIAGPLFNFAVVGICLLISVALNYPILDRVGLLLTEEMSSFMVQPANELLMPATELKKFDSSENFDKIFENRQVRLYRINYN